MDELLGFDHRLFLFLYHTHLAQQYLPVWVFLTALASSSWIGLTCVGLFLSKGKRRMAATCTAMVVSLMGVLFVCKKIVLRPRPPDVLHEVYARFGELDGFSFPSGHAARSWAMAVFFICLLFDRSPPGGWSRTGKRCALAALLCLLASGICLSRVMLGMHFPSDVLVGGMLGGVFGAVGARVYLRGQSLLESVPMLLLRSSSWWRAALPFTLCTAALSSCFKTSHTPSAHPQEQQLAVKWGVRAQDSFRAGDMDDALDALYAAKRVSPLAPPLRILGGRVALANLAWAEGIQFTQGLSSAEALAVRGRAHWYAGHMEQAAEDLEALLRNPEVKDPWAKQIAHLAREGAGRTPFRIEGKDLVTVVEMPKGGWGVVPCVLYGEQVLALVSTSNQEVMIDSALRKDPAWIHLRFAGLEVSDVPALPQDLTPLSRKLGAPIRLILGTHFLRTLHVTCDRRGDQFVLRREAPLPPPDALRIPIWYTPKGMLIQAEVSSSGERLLPFLLDSLSDMALSLGAAAWKQGGVIPVPQKTETGHQEPFPTARLPLLRWGGLDLPNVPVVAAGAVPSLQESLQIEVSGILGGPLLSAFRVTWGDHGRTLWIESEASLEEPSTTGGRP